MPGGVAGARPVKVVPYADLVRRSTNLRTAASLSFSRELDAAKQEN